MKVINPFIDITNEPPSLTVSASLDHLTMGGFVVVGLACVNVVAVDGVKS